MIDLAHSFASTDCCYRRRDFGMFLCSWLHIPIKDRERGWRDALLQKGPRETELVELVVKLYTDAAEPLESDATGPEKSGIDALAAWMESR